MPGRAWKAVSFPSGKAFRILSVALGIFLLTTAGLKAHGLTIDPLAQDSFLASPRLLVATIEIEIILGLWLLSGWSARLAWTGALAFFGVLAAVSFYLAVQGQTSCGCFGRVTVSPWLTFIFDVLVAIVLLICPPARMQVEPSLNAPVRIGLGTCTFVALIAGIFYVAFGEPSHGLALLRGESITVEPSTSKVGEGQAGDQGRFIIQLRNHGDRSVCIMGGTTNCACIATGDLPITVPPREFRPVEVKVNFHGEPGRFQHSFILYTDDEKQPTVLARFSGRVIRAN